MTQSVEKGAADCKTRMQGGTCDGSLTTEAGLERTYVDRAKVKLLLTSWFVWPASKTPFYSLSQRPKMLCF